MLIQKKFRNNNFLHINIIALFAGFVQRHETEKFWVEVEFNLTNGAMAVLSDNQLGNVSVFVVVIMNLVIVWTVQEYYKVGVLLDRTGLA